MKKYIIIAIIIIISFFVGFFVARSTYVKKINEAIAQNDIKYQEGWENAKKRLIDRGVYNSGGGEEVYKDIINGDITEIKGNKLVIKIVPFKLLSDPELDYREVIISDDTKITKTVKKSDEEYKQEVEQYYLDNPEEVNNPNFGIDYPSMFKDAIVTMSEFAVGQKITAKASEDIVEKKSFKIIEATILDTK